MLQISKFILSTFEESPAWMAFFHALQEFLTPPEFFEINWDGIIDGSVKGPALSHGASKARKFCRHQPTSSYYQIQRTAVKYENTATWRLETTNEQTYDVSSESGFWYKLDTYHWYSPCTSNILLGAVINGSANVTGIHNNILTLDSDVASITSITLQADPSSITNTLFDRTEQVYVDPATDEARAELKKHNSQTRPINIE